MFSSHGDILSFVALQAGPERLVGTLSKWTQNSINPPGMITWEFCPVPQFTKHNYFIQTQLCVGFLHTKAFKDIYLQLFNHFISIFFYCTQATQHFLAR